MSEDYKLQVSVKFGPNGTGMLNVRANDAAELLGLLSDIEGELPVKLGVTIGDLEGLAALGQAFPQSQVVGSTPAPAAAGTQACLHGAMTARSGGSGADAWQGYFCPQPKGAADRCKPVYPGR